MTLNINKYSCCIDEIELHAVVMEYINAIMQAADSGLSTQPPTPSPQKR